MASFLPPPGVMVYDGLDHFMALAHDGAVRDIGRLRRLRPDDGWLVGIKDAPDDAAVHGDVWERHPGGDELLYVLQGRVVLTLLDERDAPRDTLVGTWRSAVVPRGVWHRLHIACPARILFVTPGRGSEHRHAGA